MRHLALLLTLLLASLTLAATARALPAAPASQPLPLLSEAEAEEADDEVEADDEIDAAEEAEFAQVERESCEKEGLFCEEEDEGEDEDDCVLDTAKASVAANPGKGKVRVTVRYTASAPTTFTLDYSLRGGKGGLHLGTARAHFHRAGVFHDVLEVGDKRAAKLQAARQFLIELHAVGTPSYCREDLTEAAPHRSSRRHRAGG